MPYLSIKKYGKVKMLMGHTMVLSNSSENLWLLYYWQCECAGNRVHMWNLANKDMRGLMPVLTEYILFFLAQTSHVCFVHQSTSIWILSNLFCEPKKGQKKIQLILQPFLRHEK